MGVKAIMRKYDCKSYTTTGRQAERLLMLLMKKCGEEGYRDALEMSKVIGGKSEMEMEKMFLEHLLRKELTQRRKSRDSGQIWRRGSREDWSCPEEALRVT